MLQPHDKADIHELSVEMPAISGIEAVKASYEHLKNNPEARLSGLWAMVMKSSSAETNAQLMDALLLEEFAPGAGTKRYETLRRLPELCHDGTWFAGFYVTASGERKPEQDTDGQTRFFALLTEQLLRIGHPTEEEGRLLESRPGLVPLFITSLTDKEKGRARFDEYRRVHADPRGFFPDSIGDIHMDKEMLGILLALELGEKGVQDRYETLKNVFYDEEKGAWHLVVRGTKPLDGSIHMMSELLALYVEARLFKMKSSAIQSAERAIPSLLTIN